MGKRMTHFYTQTITQPNMTHRYKNKAHTHYVSIKQVLLNIDYIRFVKEIG